MPDPLIVPAHNTKLKVKISTTFVEVVGVTTLSVSGWGTESIPTTHLSSTFKTSRPSAVPNAATLTGTLLFDPADSTHAALKAMSWTPTITDWQVVLADDDATTYQFSGYLNEFGLDFGDLDANVEAPFTITQAAAATVVTP